MKSKGEGWIYDGCSDLHEEEVDELLRKYGFLRYLVMSRIPKLHGFTWKEFNTKIKNILERTKFKDSYQMVLIDTWMKITLKKNS